MVKERKFDLQDRFIDFAVRIIRLSEAMLDIGYSSETGRKVRSA